jgi:hypothetical protein
MSPPNLDHLMARGLGGLLNGNFGAAVQEAFRPLLEQAFRNGYRAGVEFARKATAAPLDEALRELVAAAPPAPHIPLVSASGSKAPGPRRPRRVRPRQSGRAAPGSVRPAVELALEQNPGARIIDIQRLATSLDPTISATSVTNELRRNSGTRYRQEGVRWFFIGGSTEKGKGEARSFANEPDLLVERPSHAAA